MVFGEGIKVDGAMVGLDEGAAVVEVIDGVVVDLDGAKVGTMEGDAVDFDGGKVGFGVEGTADGTKLVVCEG